MKIGKPPVVRRDSEQSIMPLINIVFLLLIFFMVAGKLTRSDPVALFPPQSDSRTPADQHDEMLLIDREGQLYYRGERLALADLTETASAMVATGNDEGILVKADAEAPTGLVLQIIADVRKAGVPVVRLLTVEPAE